MNRIKLGGKVEDVMLNKHIVTVIRPKDAVSYEKGNKEVDKLISKIKKK